MKFEDMTKSIYHHEKFQDTQIYVDDDVVIAADTVFGLRGEEKLKAMKIL